MAQVEELESGEVGEGRIRDAHDVVPREGEFPQSPGPLEDRRVDDLNLQKVITVLDFCKISHIIG